MAKVVDWLSRSVSWAAAAFIFAMMMVTVADVLLRSLFSLPIFGTFDLVELFLVAAIFLAVPETFRREEHVVVNVIDHLVPPRVTQTLRVTGIVLATGYLALILWNSVGPAYDTYRFGDETLDLGLPRFIHWIPILFGTAAAILVLLRVLLGFILEFGRGE